MLRKRQRYPNGDIYDGEWLDGKRHGRGVYTYKNVTSMSESLQTTCAMDSALSSLQTRPTTGASFEEGGMRESG